MVEPSKKNIETGINNFKINGYIGEFINRFVGKDDFMIDSFLRERNIDSVDILHSDIQGFEVEMLQGATAALSERKIKYAFISTHSEDLHQAVVGILKSNNYRIEVSSGFALHTTSCDGFIMASSCDVEPVFNNFNPLGRLDICTATPSEVVEALIAAASSTA